MNRRKALASIIPLPLVALTLPKPVKKWGLIDPDKHFQLRKQGTWLRVIFNGEDVTGRCKLADDTFGRVLLFLYDDNGNIYLNPDTQEVAQETFHGDVRFIECAPWSKAVFDIESHQWVTT